ncbi:MAG: hypothetical protein AAFV19_17730 [Pseudomonadota bacterium]
MSDDTLENGQQTPLSRTDEARQFFQKRHQKAMDKAVGLLSTLTFSEEQMFGDIFEAGAGLLPLPARISDLKEAVDDLKKKSMVEKLLDKCWGKVEGKISTLPWVAKIQSLVGQSAKDFLRWAKGIILSPFVPKKLIPIYGIAADLYDAWESGKATYTGSRRMAELTEAKPYMHEGFPVAAMDAFIRYAKIETAKKAGKTAYKFGKAIVSVLGQIFSFGWSTTAEFIAGIVEAITDIAISLIEAKKFDAATARLAEDRKQKRRLSGNDFKNLVKACPLLGCVFYAVAPTIGRDDIIFTFSPPSGSIDERELKTANAKLVGVVNQARD